MIKHIVFGKYFFKIAAKSRIINEYHNYQVIKNIIPNYVPKCYNSFFLGNIGIIKFQYLLQPGGGIQISESNLLIIFKILLKLHQFSTQVVTNDLIFPVIKGNLDAVSLLKFYYLIHSIKPIKTKINWIHGDLHLKNILIMKPNIYLIDFNSLKIGHIAVDFVKIELSIIRNNLRRLNSLDIYNNIYGNFLPKSSLYSKIRVIKMIKMIRSEFLVQLNLRDSTQAEFIYYIHLLHSITQSLQYKNDKQKTKLNLYLFSLVYSIINSSKYIYLKR